MADNTVYRRITIRSGERSFSVYCAQDSLDSQYEKVMSWVTGLARRLQWVDFQMAVTRASMAEATEREHALYEHRFPNR